MTHLYEYLLEKFAEDYEEQALKDAREGRIQALKDGELALEGDFLREALSEWAGGMSKEQLGILSVSIYMGCHRVVSISLADWLKGYQQRVAEYKVDRV